MYNKLFNIILYLHKKYFLRDNLIDVNIIPY